MLLSENLTSSRYQFALDSVEELLPALRHKVVFDIGAGDGRMREVRRLGVEWRGFDQTAANDIAAWDLDEPFPYPDRGLAEVALLMDVIEHCLNPGLALRNVADSIEASGWLILTTPNIRWSRSRVTELLTGTPACFTQSDLDLNHHVFLALPHVLEKMLRDVGLTVQKYVTLDGPTNLRRPRLLLRPDRLLANLLMAGIEALDRTACGMSLGLIARKGS